MHGSPRVKLRVILLVGAISLAPFVGARLIGHKERATPTLSVMQTLGPGPADDRFARAAGPREFCFPRDHGPHPEFRNEWWYWTGNLESSGGHRYGYQLTIFRSALQPEVAVGRTSAWATRDVYMAHFTLTDVATGRFFAYERISRAAVDLAGARASPFRVWILDWSAEGPILADAAATPMRLRAQNERVAIDFELEQGKAPVLQGDHGLSEKGRQPGNASYYYSLTRMPTAGFVAVGDDRVPVRGESWMDREWSTSALDADQVGWDWVGLQLADGRDLMFFRLRRVDGSSHPMSSGALVERDGTSRRLSAEEVTMEPVGSWTSSRSMTTYPALFRMRVAAVGLDLEIIPLVKDQELDLTFRYWEGAARVQGSASGEPLTGRGYLEMTGYGDTPHPTR